MIKIENVSYSYKKQKVLDNLSCTIEKGQIVGLVAPNGTGKTTLLNVISNNLKKKSGDILVNDVDYSRRKQYLKQLFFIESVDNLVPNLTVLDHLQHVKNMWKSSISIHKVLESLKMSYYKNKRVSNLSLGMKQHLIIAMYIVSDASLLLMDEPHNGLDPSSVQLIKEVFLLLKKQNKTIFYSSHDLFNMENFCDQVFFLKNQKIHLSVASEQNLFAIYNELYLEEDGGVELWN
uniref:ABC transporter ATP-binding protein n=1 Tax=Candidatus Enterococcus willemsii TaxID=1857215 RepID=UPI00403F2A24